MVVRVLLSDEEWYPVLSVETPETEPDLNWDEIEGLDLPEDLYARFVAARQEFVDASVAVRMYEASLQPKG